MTLKHMLAAASALAIMALGGKVAATTVITAAPSNFAAVVTAKDSLTTAPSSTSWVCFQDTDVAIQVAPTAGNAYPIVERSDTNPAVAANPVAPVPPGGYAYPIAYSVNYHEAGRGWWRVRIVSAAATILLGYQFPTGAVATSSLPISVSMSGKGC